MDAKICIDKRIWYLLLFSVPLILLAFFSAVINSTPLYQGSRAAGLAPTSIIKPTMSPTPSANIIRTTCLLAAIKDRSGKNMVELSLKNAEQINKTNNLKIYSYSKQEDGSKVMYLSLQQPPLNTLILTRPESDFAKGIYSFIGFQGNIPNIGSQQSAKREEDYVLEAVRQCPSYNIPVKSD